MGNGLEKSIWNQYLFNNPMVREKNNAVYSFFFKIHIDKS